MKTARVSDLKSRLSEHLRAVEAGETIEVHYRARAIARIVPITDDEGALQVDPPERPFASVRNVRLKAAEITMSSLEALRQERGGR